MFHSLKRLRGAAAVATAARTAVQARTASLEPLEGRQLFSFTISDAPAFGTAVLETEFARVDADGVTDAVSLTTDGAGNFFVIASKGAANGTYTPYAVAPANAGTGAERIAVGNFDGNAFADVAVANNTGGGVRILLGNGDGTFTNAGTVGNGAPAYDVQVGRFDNDAIDDLAILHTGDHVDVFRGLGGAAFTNTYVGPATLNAPNADARLILGDFNGDTFTDWAYGNDNTNEITVELNPGDNSASNFVTLPNIALGGGATVVDLAAGPLDNGLTDDLAVLRSNNTVRRITFNTLGTPSGATNVSFGAGGGGVQSVTLGYLNPTGSQDDFLDIAVVRANGQVEVAKNAGPVAPGLFGAPTLLSPKPVGSATTRNSVDITAAPSKFGPNLVVSNAGTVFRGLTVYSNSNALPGGPIIPPVIPPVGGGTVVTLANGTTIDTTVVGVLKVTGTAGRDYIYVDRFGADAKLSIGTSSNKSALHTSTYSGLVKIILLGEGQDDKLDLDENLTIPAVLDGGSGNDTLRGGAVGDVLIGGLGADDLEGENGDDLLIAGLLRTTGAFTVDNITSTSINAGNVAASVVDDNISDKRVVADGGGGDTVVIDNTGSDADQSVSGAETVLIVTVDA
jgi:hypothetical protein